MISTILMVLLQATGPGDSIARAALEACPALIAYGPSALSTEQASSYSLRSVPLRSEAVQAGLYPPDAVFSFTELPQAWVVYIDATRHCIVTGRGTADDLQMIRQAALTQGWIERSDLAPGLTIMQSPDARFFLDLRHVDGHLNASFTSSDLTAERAQRPG